MADTVKVGYEVGTGAEVAVPINHMCVTGQTQVAGKTTALEAMVARSGMSAIAFVTKRFESGFKDGRRLPPYFRERTDWQFVSSVLEATLKERMKFQRSWIMKLCEQRKEWRAPKSLADVLANTEIALRTARGIHEGVYTELRSYLRLVVPQIEQANFSKDMYLMDGLNVMDVGDFSSEMQALIIQSVLAYIYRKHSHVISVIPEAWEFIPQKRNSPVKLAAVELIRKGAAGKNYVWLDSQDIAGVDKELLRSCVVWLLGVQRERNEVKRTLAQIPFGSPKPTVEDIMGLGLGQFFVCYGRTMKKVYVQPSGMTNDFVLMVAQGKEQAARWRMRNRNLDALAIKYDPKPGTKWTDIETEDEKMWKEKAEALERENKELKKRIEVLEKAALYERPLSHDRLTPKQEASPTIDPLIPKLKQFEIETDLIYERVLERLKQEPQLYSVNWEKPEIEVRRTRKTVNLDDSSLRGRMAILIAESFYDQPKGNKDTLVELKRRGWDSAAPRVSEAFDWFTTAGFFVREGDTGVRAVKDMKVNLIEE